MLSLPLFTTITDYLSSVGVKLRAQQPSVVILDLAKLPDTTSFNLTPCRRSFYQVNILFFAEAGSYRINTGTLKHQPGTAYFVSPDHVYAWERDNKMRGYLIYFTPEALGKEASRIIQELEPLFGLSAANYLPLSGSALTTFGIQLQLIHRLFDQHNSPLVMQYSLLQLLFCLLEEHNQTPTLARTNRAEHLLGRYRNEISKHFRSEHRVTTYARWIGVSPNYLNALCRKQFNRSAKELIEDRLLLEATCLLKTTDHDVAEIADWLGFNASTHFSRFFRRHKGMSPSRYRHQR